MPTCRVSFKADPQIRVRADVLARMDAADVEAWVARCPKGVFAQDGRAARPRECNMCRECIVEADALGVPELVRLDASTSNFLFTVESTGVLAPADIVLQALRIVQLAPANSEALLLEPRAVAT